MVGLELYNADGSVLLGSNDFTKYIIGEIYLPPCYCAKQNGTILGQRESGVVDVPLAATPDSKLWIVGDVYTIGYHSYHDTTAYNNDPLQQSQSIPFTALYDRYLKTGQKTVSSETFISEINSDWEKFGMPKFGKYKCPVVSQDAWAVALNINSMDQSFVIADALAYSFDGDGHMTWTTNNYIRNLIKDETTDIIYRYLWYKLRCLVIGKLDQI